MQNTFQFYGSYINITKQFETLGILAGHKQFKLTNMSLVDDDV